MALIICPDCGNQISDRAPACPHCGAPVIKTITCEDCGQQVPENESACPNCGAPIESSSQPMATPQQPFAGQTMATPQQPFASQPMAINTDKSLTIQFNGNPKYLKQILVNGKDYTANSSAPFTIPLPSPCQVTINHIFASNYTFPSTQNLILEIRAEGPLRNQPRVILYNQHHQKIFRDGYNIGLQILSLFIPLVGIILGVTKSKENPIDSRYYITAAMGGFVLGILYFIFSIFM